jgi:hypothetical protein
MLACPQGLRWMIEPAVRPATLGCRAALLLFCVLLVWCALLATPALTQNHPPARGRAPGQNDVSVALVLAVDTSGSVSMDRFELQKQGYAAAFRNPQVLGAIRSLGTRSIAVTMFQWTGPLLHVVVADWTPIKDQPSAERFAAAVQAAPRRLFGGGTSISGAIDYGRVLLAQSPYRGARRIIDISGDGSNNSGRPAAAARNEAVADGIGINGLPILTVEPGLDQYYANNVIGGPGAFMIPARNYDTFADAVLKKLINEIAMFHGNDGRPQDSVPLRCGGGRGVPQTRPSLRENSRSGCSPSRDG